MTLAQENTYLSEQYRSFVQTLTAFQKASFEKTLIGVFSGAALRNVQLWGTVATQRRDIINAQLTELERNLRITFVRALVLPQDTTMPIKVTDFDDDPVASGLRLRRWFADPFVVGDNNRGGNLLRIEVLSTGELRLTVIDDSPIFENQPPLQPDDPAFDGILV